MSTKSSHTPVKVKGELFFKTKCLYCSSKITVKRTNQKFCNSICRNSYCKMRKRLLTNSKEKRIAVFESRLIVIDKLINDYRKRKLYEKAAKAIHEKENLLIQIQNLKK